MPLKFMVCTTLFLAAVLAVPMRLGAGSAKAGASAQSPQAAVPGPTPGGASAETGKAQPHEDASTKTGKKDKNKKNTQTKKAKKKSACVSPPADSGLPDYCRNPYWDPKDWWYIYANNGADH
ncbi:MAG: hypothetical protein ABSD88_08420 [Candidatus Korobacteraceae bacterium]|jgi:hypothetical protein